MKLPVEVAPGQDISAKAFNSVIRYLRSLKLTGGPGIWVVQTMGGTTVKLAPQSKIGGAGITSIEHPFLVSNASTETAAEIKVKTGSVNDVIPTGIAPATQTLTAAGTWRVYLDCTLNTAGTVTAVAVAVTSGGQPADTSTHAYITLALVTVVAIDGGFTVSDIDQLATHSLRFGTCGRTESVQGTYNFWGF